jgi:pyrimidine oxygenase
MSDQTLTNRKALIMPAKDYGIFLPIGNGGWMLSTTAPHPEAKYAWNRRAAIYAENIGLDFIMSMAKWRGFGGTTDHWGRSLESMTMMSALAEVTSRVKIWATMHANVHNPAVAAKMYTTLQDISGGRAGMNIVNGAYADEFRQFGVWADLSHTDRYVMTELWTEAVVRLWTEDSVTMNTPYFTLAGCQSRPHPVARPTIISAGKSEDARKFQAKYADGAFLAADSLDEMRELSRDVHERAAARGRTCKTYSMLTVVQDETDELANEKVKEWGAGVDREALALMHASWGVPKEQARAWAAGAVGEAAFQTAYVAGSAETLTEHISYVVREADLDGLMLIFPEYDEDMLLFGKTVLPVLRELDALQEHQVVAVHDLAFVLLAKLAGQPASGTAHQARYLLRVVVHQAPPNHPAVLVTQIHRVASLEAAVHAGDAGREQRGAALHYRLDRATVQAQAAPGGRGMRQPQQPRRGPLPGGREVRPRWFPSQRRRGGGGSRHHRRDARGRGDQRGLDLCRHPAGAHPAAVPAATADLDARQVRRAAHLSDPARAARVASARVAVVEPVHVRKQDQRLRSGHVRDQSGEPVVVAEPDLVRGHRVVLVDHREHAELKQPVERALRVPVVPAPHQVVRGEQHLAGADAVPGELRRVPCDQQPLADARRRLLGGQVARPLPQAERRHARRDRAGGDQQHLPAATDPGRESSGQRLDADVVDRATACGQRGGADLDHNSRGLGDVGAGRLRHPSSLQSVPRGPGTCRRPAVRAGSQSKTTASSGSPMSTVSPGSAPASARASSTPSLDSRSAR